MQRFDSAIKALVAASSPDEIDDKMARLATFARTADAIGRRPSRNANHMQNVGSLARLALKT